MTEYLHTGVMNKTLYKRYNRPYTTPVIFETFDFNAWALIVSVVVAMAMVYFIPDYSTFVFVDAGMAMAYLFMLVVIKEMYRFGVLNKTVLYGTAHYKLAAYVALMLQSALYRSIIGLCYYCRQEYIALTPENIALVAISATTAAIIATLSVMAAGSKKYAYNKIAQKNYSAILEGPESMGETTNELMKNSLDFKIASLNRPEMATMEFFKKQEKFMSSGTKIKQLLSNYDEEWRKAMVYSSYLHVTDIGRNDAARVLVATLEEHRKNAAELNRVVCEINAIKVVTPSQYQVRSTKRTVTKPVPATAVPQSKKNDDFWDTIANWYN